MRLGVARYGALLMPSFPSRQVDYSNGVAAGRWEYFDHVWKPYDSDASDVVEKVQ
jgi:hypothetical protein